MCSGVRHLIIGVLRAKQYEVRRVAIKIVFGEKFFCRRQRQIARRLLRRRNVPTFHADFFHEASVDNLRVMFNRRGQVARHRAYLCKHHVASKYFLTAAQNSTAC